MAGMFDDLLADAAKKSATAPAAPAKTGLFDDLVPTAPAAPAAPVNDNPGDEQSIWQQMFDIRNAETNESYLYGNKPKATGFDDVTRIMGDTGLRGWGSNDKLVAEARERTPGYIETPADITAVLATTPYRIGGAIAGAGVGAADAALRSYGNQEGWMPEWGNIAQDTAVGAALGSGGAALPKVWNAGKDALQKFGSIPKWKTALFDYAFLGAPVATGTSTTAKVISAVTPKLPAGPVTRDVLAKTMMTMGGRQAE